MPPTTLTAKSPRTPRSTLTPTVCSLTRAARLTPRGPLARYTDHAGRLREVLALPGHGDSVLVVDRDAATWGDRRLVAHLAADEPLENAHLVCRHYLRDPRPRRCRPLAPEDLLTAPFSEGCLPREVEELDRLPPLGMVELRDRRGCRHRLQPLATGLSIPELRWCRREGVPAELGLGLGRPASDSQPESGRSFRPQRGGELRPERAGDLQPKHGAGLRPERRGDPQPESVRDAVACMEGYEPVRALTVRALAHHHDDDAVSVAVLRSELQRLDASRIVLNRGLRRAVLHAMRTQGLSLSEIAHRCGRVKRDGKGHCSGETSWLSRRVGISPEGGGDGEPTPWIHSEVLAVIARDGLGISPREVEL
jgi:hypothetical protein